MSWETREADGVTETQVEPLLTWMAPQASWGSEEWEAEGHNETS